MEPPVDKGHINGSASESRSHIERSTIKGIGKKRKQCKRAMRCDEGMGLRGKQANAQNNTQLMGQNLS